MSLRVPVVLCGGIGERLWPLSTPQHPKPFLSLLPGPTLYQRALRRAAAAGGGPGPLVVGAASHHALLTRQAPPAPPRALLLESAPSGTALAVAIAVAWARRVALPDPAVLQLLPADHHVDDERAFGQALDQAASVAEQADGLVVLGARPRYAATAYGWIAAGPEPVDALSLAVTRFHEKPDPPAAEAFLAAGYRWNAGVFVGRVDRFEAHLRALAPDVQDAAISLLSRAQPAGERALRLPCPPAGLPASFDRAILEAASQTRMVPLHTRWHDLGTWDALYEASAPDAHGNVTRGDVRARRCRGCLMIQHGPSPLVAEGERGMILVATPHGTLRRPLQHLRDPARSAHARGMPVPREVVG